MLITLTTDFGLGGRYVAQMKGVLYRKAPGVTVVDLSHAIPPQDVAAGARFLEQSTTNFPAGTVHLAVIDPGVGSDREIVAVHAHGQFYVGPDNGLFGWTQSELTEAVAIDLPRLNLKKVSNTFHGRDIMAPVAAWLAKGAKLTDLGEPRQELVRLPESEPPVATEGGLEGRVVEVDHYGNLITNVEAAMLGDAPCDERLRIALGEHETFGLWRTYADQPPQTLLALVGSTGHVELAITGGSAATMLGAGVGEAVRIDWDKSLS
ncbi:Adenosyl-chloride synthase [Planctomycetes bacterium MalM25]|nr:Adenosyl-chloride synthase [Planctomycetes bacterium MalM25]